MFTIEIRAEEVKNEQGKVTSLPIELKGIYKKMVEVEGQQQEVTYESIQSKEEIFDPVKDELTLSEKSQLTGAFLSEKLQTIISDLKTQSGDNDLGKMVVKVY